MTMATVETFSCETERLHLRPLLAGDEALFQELYTDSQTMRHIGSPLSAEQATSTFHMILAGMRQQPFRCLYLAVLDKVSMRPLGICGVRQFRADAIRQEVGLVLTKSARSRGIAREGLSALVDRIFALSPVDEVWAQFSGENLAAQQLVVAVGFHACDEEVSRQGISSKRRWSVHRSSWRGGEPN